jgi:hypothetical protein
MPLIRIEPAPGRLTLNPKRNFQPVPQEGATVELDAFWSRALADGDVVISKPNIAPVESVIALPDMSGHAPSDDTTHNDDVRPE